MVAEGGGEEGSSGAEHDVKATQTVKRDEEHTSQLNITKIPQKTPEDC